MDSHPGPEAVMVWMSRASISDLPSVVVAAFLLVKATVVAAIDRNNEPRCR